MLSEINDDDDDDECEIYMLVDLLFTAIFEIHMKGHHVSTELLNLKNETMMSNLILMDCKNLLYTLNSVGKFLPARFKPRFKSV